MKTPSGEKQVNPGDIIAFPTLKNGAHKLTNSSEKDMLVYLDFDTYNSPEVSFMPDSGKAVFYGQGLRRIIKDDVEVDYYDGE